MEIVKQPFPMLRFGIIQLEQAFITGCLGYQAVNQFRVTFSYHLSKVMRYIPAVFL